MLENDYVMYMYATVIAIALVCILLIVYRIEDDRVWKKYLYVAINDIRYYGDGGPFFAEFVRGWAKRKHPDLDITVPEAWRDAVEVTLLEMIQEMKRESLISKVEVAFVGQQFKLEVSARNW